MSRPSCRFGRPVLQLLAASAAAAVPLPARLVAQDSATARAPVELERTHVIGCADCEGPELFAGVADIVVREGGGVVVADRAPPFVRAFGPDGKPRFQAMPEGEGPSEARSVTRLAVLSGGRVVTLDNRLRRLTVLDAEGATVETLRPDAFPLGLHGTADGWGFWTIETTFRDPPRFVAWTGESFAPATVEIDLSDLGVVEEDLPFQLWPASAGPDGLLALGDGETDYRIRVFGPDGGLRHTISRDLPRLEKSDEEVEFERTERARARGRLAGVARDSPEENAFADDIEIDPLHRHFLLHDLALDPSGRLWVRTPRGGAARTVFDLFGPEGAFLGEVGIDGRVSRFDVSADALAAVVLDEFDVASVHVYRIDDD